MAVSGVQGTGAGQWFPVALPGFMWKLTMSTAAAIAFGGFGQGNWYPVGAGVAIQLVLRVVQIGRTIRVSGGHHDLRRRIDRSGGAGSGGAIATLVDHAAAGDDAVRIFSQTRELGEAARPVERGIGLVPDFPVLDVSVRLQVRGVVGVGGDCSDPCLPDGVGSSAIGCSDRWGHRIRRRLRRRWRWCSGRIVSDGFERGPRRSAGQRVHSFHHTAGVGLSQY